MTSQKDKDKDTDPDIGASIISGAIVLLALYGGYKLFGKDKKEEPIIESTLGAEILAKIVGEDVKL